MTAIERTAYPRFKQILSAKDLAEIYTPTPAERLAAHRTTKGRVAEVGFLMLLKTYQRLGRFVSLSEVPSSIIEHIAKPFGLCCKKEADLVQVGKSRTKRTIMIEQPPFKWRHFQDDIILLCVRWYLRSALSSRDLEEMMLEHGLQVDHTTISRWVQCSAPELEKRCRPHLKTPNDSPTTCAMR